jgi:hypothetical protein
MKRLALIFVATLAGCLHATPVEYSGPVRVDSAELIAINPDVKVVADSEEPMFFAAGSYWLFHDGGWYRAPRINTTWVKVKRPPVPVVQIDQPYAFTNYRDDHRPAERTASVETDNTVAKPAQPNFQFKQNALGFEK